MRLSVRLDKLLAPGNRHLQEQLIFCMRNRSAPRYSCQAPLARVCTKPQGLFHGLSLPVEAAKHKHRLPTLESRSFNPPVQKVLSNHFSLNCKCKKDEKCSENAWNTSVWSYFSSEKEKRKKRKSKKKKKPCFSFKYCFPSRRTPQGGWVNSERRRRTHALW